MLPMNRLVDDFKETVWDNLNEMNNLKNRRIDDSDSEEYNDDDYFEKEYKELQEKMEEIFTMNEEYNNLEYSENYYKENFYSYDTNNILLYDLKDYLEKNPFPEKFHICPYQVNNSGFKPFLQFFLRKYPENHETYSNKITFLSFEGLKTYDSVLNKCYKALEVIFLSYMKVSYYNYKGFIEFNNEIYLFYDCTNSKIGTHRIDKMNDLWLVLMDEIINTRKICNYTIDPLVSNLFLQNPDLIYLTDSKRVKYEIPVSVYTGRHDSKIDFVSVFGVSRNDNEYDALLGQYFYFTDYETAINMIENNPSKKNGVIRFALFMGHTKVPMNLPNDCPDLSEKTQKLLLNDITTTTDAYKRVRSSLKISDRDGKWTEDYDSVYIGKLILDNDYESESINGPYWVSKEYEQQTPLTYHIIKF